VKDPSIVRGAGAADRSDPGRWTECHSRWSV